MTVSHDLRHMVALPGHVVDLTGHVIALMTRHLVALTGHVVDLTGHVIALMTRHVVALTGHVVDLTGHVIALMTRHLVALTTWYLRYQITWFILLGMSSMAQASEIALASVILSDLICEWKISVAKVGLI